MKSTLRFLIMLMSLSVGVGYGVIDGKNFTEIYDFVTREDMREAIVQKWYSFKDIQPAYLTNTQTNFEFQKASYYLYIQLVLSKDYDALKPVKDKTRACLLSLLDGHSNRDVVAWMLKQQDIVKVCFSSADDITQLAESDGLNDLRPFATLIYDALTNVAQLPADFTIEEEQNGYNHTISKSCAVILEYLHCSMFTYGLI